MHRGSDQAALNLGLVRAVGDDDRFFAFEVVEERPTCDVGRSGDVVDGHRIEPALLEQGQRCGADGPPGLHPAAPRCPVTRNRWPASQFPGPRDLGSLCRGTVTLVMVNGTSRLAEVPRSRPLSRDRTRCPRCPASGGTTRCGHRHAVVARVPRRARPVVRTRPRVRRRALHPRARCRPARQDAADS